MNIRLRETHKNFEGHTQFWEHDSKLTKSVMRFSTFIPATKPKGCILWLSGLTCSEENFIIKSGAQRYLADAGLMVICPDTSPRLPELVTEDGFGVADSFYVDAITEPYKTNYQIYSYIVNEVYALIQEHFKIPAAQISLAGHSMGGHGALMIGLRNPEKFKVVSAFAPLANASLSPLAIKSFKGYLGDDRKLWLDYDATELIKQGSKHPREILIDTGAEDEYTLTDLFSDNFVQACKEQGQALDFNLHKGYGHNYYFVSTFIGKHIAFHAA